MFTIFCLLVDLLAGEEGNALTARTELRALLHRWQRGPLGAQMRAELIEWAAHVWAAHPVAAKPAAAGWCAFVALAKDAACWEEILQAGRRVADELEEELAADPAAGLVP